MKPTCTLLPLAAILLAKPLSLKVNEPLKLHIIVDASVIEVIANDRACMTGRVYPWRRDSVSVRVTEDQAEALRSLDIWQL